MLTAFVCIELMPTESSHWAATEFEQLDLGDARLDQLARTLLAQFAANPGASVPKDCHTWGEAMAAYRFFDNDRVDWRAIFVDNYRDARGTGGWARLNS